MKNAAPEYEKFQRQNAKLLTLIAAELKDHETKAYDEEQMHAQIETEIAE